MTSNIQIFSKLRILSSVQIPPYLTTQPNPTPLNLQCFFRKTYSDTGLHRKSIEQLFRSKFTQLTSLFRWLVVALVTCLVIAPVMSYAEGTPSPQYKDSQPPTPLIVGFLGDSLSAAFNLRENQGWVALIEKRIQQAYPSPSKPVKFVNASVSGATTDAGLHILPNLLKASPDIVFLELGANDGLQGKPIPHITQNLRSLIKQLQSSGSEVILMEIHLPPNLGKRYTGPFLNQYAQLAQEYQIELMPFLLAGVAGKNDLMMEDGLHPNAKGQQIIANNLWPIVNKIINKHLQGK